MPPTAELPHFIDSTMMSTFRSCPRKFYHEFVLGLRPASLSVDLHAGACFAHALEVVYAEIGNGLTLEAAMMKAFASYMTEWGDFEPIKDTPKTRERIWEAVEEYFKTWAPLTDPVQPFKLDGKASSEFTFGIPLLPIAEGPLADTIYIREKDVWPTHPSGEPFIYSGRFDMLGLWAGRPIVRDEKTTTSIGAAWADSWDLRAQFMGYVWACQQSGLQLDTVCVRGVGILKTKFTMIDAFKVYPRWKIERWLEQTRRDLWRLRRAWDENYWDFNLGDSCTSYGGCHFRSLCNSEMPERWMGEYSVRRWNPLQKNPIEEKPDATN